MSEVHRTVLVCDKCTSIIEGDHHTTTKGIMYNRNYTLGKEGEVNHYCYHCMREFTQMVDRRIIC